MINIEAYAKRELEFARTYLQGHAEETVIPDSSPFKSYAVMFTPRGVLQYAIQYSNPAERRRKQVLLTGMAAFLKAHLVMLVMDATRHIPKLSEEPFKTMWQEVGGDHDKYVDLLNDWRTKNYGGRIANMPRDMREDVIIVVGKGPETPVFGYYQTYQFDVISKKLIFGEFTASPPDGQLNLIGDWWKMQPSGLACLLPETERLATEIMETVLNTIPKSLGHWRERVAA